MAWENLLKKGIDIFSEEHHLTHQLNFSLKSPINPFPTFYFIFNCETSEIAYISPELIEVLGYKEEEFTIQLLLDYIHPEDHSIFIQHETKALEFCKQLSPELQDKYCVMHDFRIKTKSETYVWIQQQAYACEVKNGVLKKTLVIHSNITNLNHYDKYKLHFIGLNGYPSYYNVQDSCTTYTQKEKEILNLMVQGLSSDAISKKLNKSIHTIRNHRKSILKKSGCENVQELLVNAARTSWYNK